MEEVLGKMGFGLKLTYMLKDDKDDNFT